VRRLWRVLAGHRDLRLLLAADLVSLIGDWVLRVGLAYSVYQLTGSTLASATTLLAALLPQIGLGSLAGVLVDHWDRRRTVIWTNVLLAVGLLPLLLVHDRHQVWLVYLVTAVQSGLAQFFVAAEAALVPGLVPATDLVTANALNGQSRDIARLVGAGLGGVVAGLGGIALLTGVDAASFAVAAALLTLVRSQWRSGSGARSPSRSRLRSRSPEEEQGRAGGHADTRPGGHLWRGWVDGARIAVRDRTLRTILLFAVVTSVGEAIMGTLMAPFVRDVLHGGPQAYGTIMALQATGGILGGLGAAALGHRFSPRALAGYGALAFGALDLALFLYPLLHPALWPAGVLMVVIGLPGAATIAGLITLFQTATDDAYRGRVFGAASALEGAAMLAGALGAGTLGHRLGIVPVIATQGAGYCLGALLLLVGLRPAARPVPVPAPAT
jgi:Na+/melibiose symporter-like transporter